MSTSAVLLSGKQLHIVYNNSKDGINIQYWSEVNHDDPIELSLRIINLIRLNIFLIDEYSTNNDYTVRK